MKIILKEEELEKRKWVLKVFEIIQILLNGLALDFGWG